MQAKDAKDFASKNHPSGIIFVAPETSVKEAAKLMQEQKIHHLLVMRGEECLGTIAARDLLGERDGSAEVHELMRRNILLVDESTDIKTALSHMLEHGLTALPLTSEGKVTGILTETDLLRLLERFIEERGRVNSVVARGEAAVANPLVQNLMKALSDAGF